MKFLLVSLHARRSAQAVPLAAANLLAALPTNLRSQASLLDLYPDQSAGEMLVEIRQHDPELVSFSTYLWNRETILGLCAELKRQPSPPFILLGGPEASADPERLLASGTIDACLRGEGEQSFRLLADTFTRHQPPADIPGLCTRTALNGIAACACELEQLASPWLSLNLPPVAGGVLWEVARGCPFNCSFCYDAKGLSGVRPFPEPRLAAELDYFVTRAVEQVWVLDSSFNVPAQRGKRLLKLLHERAPQLHYHFEAKAEFIDPETIELLSGLSCSLQLGLQTADSEVLAALKRKIDPKKFWRGVERVAASPLTFGLDLIYGLPGDSFTGFCSSLETALDYRPNQVDIFPLAVLPGTELYALKAELGLQAQDRPPYLLERSSDFSPEEMQSCHRLKVATNLFYNRGRAVGFFLPFCRALQLPPLQLLDRFADWLAGRPEGGNCLAETESFCAREILDLQLSFLRETFSSVDRECWWELARDILRFHFHYAETLLGPEVLPNAAAKPPGTRLRLAEGVRLLAFRHEVLGALENEEIDLERWQRLIEPMTTYGLLLRRGGNVLVEELTDEFYRLLKRAEEGVSTAELGRDLPPEVAQELFDFAWQEGLLSAEAISTADP